MYMVTVESDCDSTQTKLHFFKNFENAKKFFDKLCDMHNKELETEGEPSLSIEKKNDNYSYWDETEELFISLKPFEFED